jgi:uridine phosphorylase
LEGKDMVLQTKAPAGRPSAPPFTAADLPIDDEGRIYHLQLKPGQIARDILVVGDPARADFIGTSYFREVELEHEHRGLVTVTGTAQLTGEHATIISPLRATATTSGMGTPSLEIVLNELVALNEIDLETRTRKSGYETLHVVRVGSSGALQTSTTLGTPIITTYAIGLDNTGLFYEVPWPDETCKRLEEELEDLLNRSMGASSRFRGMIHPYVARAEPRLVSALLQASDELGIWTKPGLTVSAPGFFAPQGREVARLTPSIRDVDTIMSGFDPGLDGQRVENMEMEASFLTHFLGGLGYWAAAICPAIANRSHDTFTCTYQDDMDSTVRVALAGLAIARREAA